AEDEENLDRQTRLASALNRMGRAELQAGDYAAARDRFQESQKILNKLNSDGKLFSVSNRRLLARTASSLAVAAKAELVMNDLSAAAKEPPESAAELMIFRAARQVELNQDELALQSAEALRQFGEKDGNRLFDVARCYARMAAV